ncbi:MAG: hypothetical protein JWO93_708 [Micrococcaceae bacterium]|jgi:hypothetical protein|nr:hypothetical protein [Micrococcaceae bacterium]
MMHVYGTAAAQVTFGRDGAMFEGLLNFVAQLSVVLWSVVILSAIIRFVGVGMYRRSARRATGVEPGVLANAIPAVPEANISPAAAPTTAEPATAAPAAAVPAIAGTHVPAAVELAAADRFNVVQPAAVQLNNAPLVRLPLSAIPATQTDVVHVSAESVGGGLIDVLTTNAARNDTLNNVLQPTAANYTEA